MSRNKMLYSELKHLIISIVNEQGFSFGKPGIIEIENEKSADRLIINIWEDNYGHSVTYLSKKEDKDDEWMNILKVCYTSDWQIRECCSLNGEPEPYQLAISSLENSYGYTIAFAFHNESCKSDRIDIDYLEL